MYSLDVHTSISISSWEYIMHEVRCGNLRSVWSCLDNMKGVVEDAKKWSK